MEMESRDGDGDERARRWETESREMGDGEEGSETGNGLPARSL